MITTVLKDFSSGKYSDSGLHVKINQILSKATGNTSIPQLADLLVKIAAKNAAYLDSLNNLQRGKPETTLLKDSLRAELELLLKQLAELVQANCGGDEATILSYGLDASRKPATIGALAKPTGLIVKPGENKGSLLVSFEVVDNAGFYEIDYTETPVSANSVWKKQTSTRHKQLIEDLTSGKEYAIRVAAAGSNPTRIWSDVITSFVL